MVRVLPGNQPRVYKPWFPNRGSRLPAEQGFKRGTKEVKEERLKRG